MRVLAGAQRVLHGAVAVLVRIGLHFFAAFRQRPGRDVARVDRVGQFLVARVFGMRLRVIEEVAVEIDIVLVDAAVEGKAVGIDRMDEEDRRVFGQVAREAFAQERRLDARAAIALDAMRARADAEDAGRICRSDAGDVGRQRFAVRAFQRVFAGGKRRTRRPRREDWGVAKW